jgi:hypothetical protein
MALYFLTASPGELLNEIKNAITEGRIDTWSYDKEGDLTHTPPQWKNLAWLRPETQSDRLALYILKTQSQAITKEVYAVYHGRFIEAMIRHCGNFFTEGISTAMPEGDDEVK